MVKDTMCSAVSTQTSLTHSPTAAAARSLEVGASTHPTLTTLLPYLQDDNCQVPFVTTSASPAVATEIECLRRMLFEAIHSNL